MPNLDGYLVIAKDTPSFVIPVLIDRPGSNFSLIQQIGTDHRISSFCEIDVGNNYEHTEFKLDYNIGDQAVWGFRSLDDDTVFADFRAMKEDLKDRLRRGEFDN